VSFAGLFLRAIGSAAFTAHSRVPLALPVFSARRELHWQSQQHTVCAFVMRRLHNFKSKTRTSSWPLFNDEETLAKGPLGEFEVVGVKVIVTDGSYHDNDSSDQSFKLCARDTMRKEILPNADVVLLEPVMTLEIEVPETFQGAVTGHLSKNRGTVTSSETSHANCVMRAEVPLAEMFDYANDLRSMTQGQGSFSMEFLEYRDAPRSVQNQVLKDRND